MGGLRFRAEPDGPFLTASAGGGGNYGGAGASGGTASTQNGVLELVVPWSTLAQLVRSLLAPKNIARPNALGPARTSGQSI